MTGPLCQAADRDGVTCHRALTPDGTCPAGHPQPGPNCFGLPDAEHLHDDIASAFQEAMDDYYDEPDHPAWLMVEEWSMSPPIYRVPSASEILDYIDECVCDELLEPGEQDWGAAIKAPDVIAATEALRELIASKVTWRQADRLVATHKVDWPLEGPPMLNGEALW